MVANKEVWLGRIACIVAILFTGWLDYLYVMRLVENWELYIYPETPNSLAKLYGIGAVGYGMFNLLVVLVVRWTWR